MLASQILKGGATWLRDFFVGAGYSRFRTALTARQFQRHDAVAMTLQKCESARKILRMPYMMVFSNEKIQQRSQK